MYIEDLKTKSFSLTPPRRFCSEAMPRWKPLYAEANTRMSGERVALAGTEGTELGHGSGFYNLQVGETFPRAEPAAGEGERTDALR